MEASHFDEREFFDAIVRSGARALLIGRQALIALGIPVVTRDYDFWIHIDDAAKLNAALAPFGFAPNRSPDDARRHGRYTLENDEIVDVLVAKVVPTQDGERVSFDEIWARRAPLDLGGGLTIFLPQLDDLVATKRFGARPKDAEDIRLLRALEENRRR